MDNIYLKVQIPEDADDVDKLRNQGLFFQVIVEAINIDRNDLIEIDETNYKQIITEINEKYKDW